MRQIPKPTTSYLVNLPMEIHFRIRDHLLKDPYTDISQLRILRLVCQLFDIIWSPVVLNNIQLFSGYQTHHDRVKYLRSLVHGKSNTLSCTTLTLQNWDYLDTDIDWFFWEMKDIWQAPRSRLVVPILILASPAMWLGKFLLGPRECFTKALDCIRSRFYASLLSRKAQFAHIRCVKMTVTMTQSRWAVYHSIRILSALPQLTELDLHIWSGVNLEHIVQCLKHVTTLCKFRLTTRSMAPVKEPRTSCLRYLIARNPNLTHLALINDDPRCDLSEIFLEIPPDKPLKLEHISLKDHRANFQALIPHIQALSSLEISGFPYDDLVFLADFMKAKIFPPTITVEYLGLLRSDVLFTFLTSHPGIINLSFPALLSQADYIGERLCSVLAQHSKLLRSLEIPSSVLVHALLASSNKKSFLQCTNLREIVLRNRYAEHMNCISKIQENSVTVDISYEKQVFSIIAHLDPSLTVGFKSILAFRASLEYCRTSDNPLTRDLAGRLFFAREKVHSPSQCILYGLTNVAPEFSAILSQY